MGGTSHHCRNHGRRPRVNTATRTPFLDSLARAQQAGATGRGEIGFAECTVDGCEVCGARFAHLETKDTTRS